MRDRHECRLTPRSRRRPATAATVWPLRAAVNIIPSRPAGGFLRGRLSSNVRRHQTTVVPDEAFQDRGDAHAARSNGSGRYWLLDGGLVDMAVQLSEPCSASQRHTNFPSKSRGPSGRRRPTRMFLDASQIKWMSVLMGFILYLLVLAWIWLFRFPRKKHDDLASYHEWRLHQDDPHASYQQYFNSDSGPKTPLTRWEQTIVATVLGALALYFALVHWSVLREF
jgi:hypothetical protein